MPKKKILVVEDESIIAEDIADSLTLLGYLVIGIIHSGEEAVQIVEEKRPDLVLMDIRLQGKMDGIAAAEEIQSRFQIPVVYLTADADDNTLRRVNSTKLFGYIVKPFEEKNLHSAIQIALHRHQHDNLTNLPNRSLFRERLLEILEQEKDQQTLVPIVSLSLDRINRINGTLGHSIGDFVLCCVAQRLANCIPGLDIVARLEAAEFAAVLSPVNHKQTASEITEKILDAISEPLIAEGYEVYITASIGIAFYPEDGSEGEELLKNAYAAMYHAQQQGGNHYQFYPFDLEPASIDKLVLETSLRNALKRSEFELYYQPQIELQTGKIIGAEALLRWNHPERGLIPPLEFIPMAEATGLIIPIGEWVLRTACQQTKRWHSWGFSELRIAVNLSARQFNQKTLPERVAQILEETNFDPQYLELEVTEGVLIRNEALAVKALDKWRSLGIQISIDDFGTGYSSLTYLKNFNFDRLKIDQSFVRNIQADDKNAAITSMIIQLAHRLKMKVLAEGVETESELNFLYQQQCDEIQGYFFSIPLTQQDFESLLKSGQTFGTSVSTQHHIS